MQPRALVLEDSHDGAIAMHSRPFALLSLIATLSILPDAADAQNSTTIAANPYRYEVWVRDPRPIDMWFIEVVFSDGTRTEVGPYESEIWAQAVVFGWYEGGSLKPGERTRIYTRPVMKPWIYIETFHQRFEAMEFATQMEYAGFEARVRTRRAWPQLLPLHPRLSLR